MVRGWWSFACRTVDVRRFGETIGTGLFPSQPDGERAGEHWQWRESQARSICWWFALDEDRNYLWRRGQICLPKGTGKSPMAAAVGCAELAGPVCFVEWDEDGEPIMRPHPSPDVKLSALSMDQASDATISLAVAMLANDDGS
jgi:hypothetical protein